MAVCYNRNTEEYKALRTEFNSPFIVDSIIRDYQLINNNDIIPSVEEAKEVFNDSISVKTITNKKAVNTIYSNLVSKGFIYQRGDKYYLTNNNIQQGRLASKYLVAAGFPKSTLQVKRGSNIIQAIVNETIDYSSIIGNIRVDKDRTHTIAVLDELASKIGGLNYAVMTPQNAETLYNLLPQEVKADVPFSEVKSFFYDGTAVLIKGRVTDAVALEEVLHPSALSTSE